jgi:hypothetical protein
MRRRAQFASCWSAPPAAQLWNRHSSLYSASGPGPSSIAGVAVRNPYGVSVAPRSPYLRRPRFRRRGLQGLGDASGAITGLEAIQQAKAAETNLNPNVAKWPGSDQQIAAWIENFQMPPYWTSIPQTQCSGQPAPKMSIFSAATGTAAGLVGASAPLVVAPIASAVGVTTGAVSAVFAGVTLGLGAIATIFTIIWAHHKAAVARDTAAECALYPAIVNTLEAVHDAVINGTMTPAQGITALTPMPGLFIQYAGKSYNHSPYCNALCETKTILDGFVRYWVGQFQQMQAVQAQQAAANPVGAAISTAASSAGIPAWLIWAGLAFGVYELL